MRRVFNRNSAEVAEAMAKADRSVAKAASLGASLRGALSQGAPGAWASDHRAETEQYTGWNYIAINAIAWQAAQAEVCVYDDREDGMRKKMRRKMLRRKYGSVRKAYQEGSDESEPLPPEHPLCELQKRPNPNQSGASFRFEQAIQLRLTGTCLVWNVPNKAGLTVERYVIPTAIATPVRPATAYPQGGWRISPEAARTYQQDGWFQMGGLAEVLGKVLDAREAQVVRLPHAMFKDDGQSPLAAGALWNDTAKQVDMSRWSHMRHGPDPSLLVTLAGDGYTQEDIDRATAKLNEKYAGAQHHGKALFVTGDKAVTLTTNPRDMQYLDGFTQFRDALLALHGTPGVAAGVTDGGSYAAFYASLLQFKTLTVQPMLDLLAEEDTEQLAPQFGPGLTIEYEAASIDDPTLIESELSTDLQAGCRTVDEFRALRGLPPWGGERGEKIAGAATDALGFGQVAQPQRDRFSTGLQGIPQLGTQPDKLPQRGSGAAQPSQSDALPSNLASSEALNGAQITAAKDVLGDVSAGRTAPFAAIELLVAVGIDRQLAGQMVRESQRIKAPEEDEAQRPVAAGLNGQAKRLKGLYP